MRRRDFLAIWGIGAASVTAARAEQDAQTRRVGVLMGYPEGDVQAQANLVAFREGLGRTGWVEGRNLLIDLRWAGADPNAARTYARQLIGLKPQVIVPSTNQMPAIVQQETRSLPIVFAFVDPIGSGFAASLSHPGGNMPGLNSTPALGSGRKCSPRSRRRSGAPVLFLIRIQPPTRVSCTRLKPPHRCRRSSSWRWRCETPAPSSVLSTTSRLRSKVVVSSPHRPLPWAIVD